MPTSAVVVTENQAAPVITPISSVAEAPPIIAPIETTPVSTEQESDNSSKRFAALARKTRELARQEQEVKKEKLAIKSAQELQNRIEQLEIEKKNLFALAKQDPERYLAEAGVTTDEMTQHYLKGIKEGKIPDLDFKLTNKAIEEIRKENAELKSTLTSFLKEREQEKYYVNTNTVGYVLNSEPTRYEVTNALKEHIDAPSVVLELMDQYKQNGVNVSVVEACDAVEKYYRELAKAITKNNSSAPPLTKPVENKTPDEKITRTLASLNNSITTAPPVRSGILTREQRRQESIRKLEREEQEMELKKVM